MSDSTLLPIDDTPTDVHEETDCRFWKYFVNITFVMFVFITLNACTTSFAIILYVDGKLYPAILMAFVSLFINGGWIFFVVRIYSNIYCKHTDIDDDNDFKDNDFERKAGDGEEGGPSGDCEEGESTPGHNNNTHTTTTTTTRIYSDIYCEYTDIDDDIDFKDNDFKRKAGDGEEGGPSGDCEEGESTPGHNNNTHTTATTTTTHNNNTQHHHHHHQHNDNDNNNNNNNNNSTTTTTNNNNTRRTPQR